MTDGVEVCPRQDRVARLQTYRHWHVFEDFSSIGGASPITLSGITCSIYTSLRAAVIGTSSTIQ